MNTGAAIIGFILCFMAGAGVMWGYDNYRLKQGGAITADNAQGGATWSDEESPVPVSSKDPMWGKREAPVTVVIFSDFQCPFCSRVEPTLDQVKTTYGPDKVRLIWKNEPLSFHEKAKPAAEAAMGVFALKGNDAFWKFHDTAFKNQQSLSPDSYEKWAKDAGVDVAQFKAGIASHKWAKKVDEDHEVAKKAGVNGTPAFFINGVLLSGAQPFDKFKETIDKELGKAQAKIAAGTAKDRVYVEMSKENKKNAPPPKEEEEEKEDTTTVFKVPVGTSPILGKKDAQVTIAIFSDFQCPYCKRVEPTIKQVREKYGDKVRVVWKHEPLPFHPRAEPAAQLSLEARAQKGDAGFWEAHDKLFESQPKLEDADLEKVAADLKLNVDKVKDAIKTHKYKKEIDADTELADDVQASGTPHMFINGRRLVGAQPADKFEKIIDEEIKKTDDMLKKGVAAKDLYDTLIKDGKGAPEPEKKNVAAPPAGTAFKGKADAKVVIQEFSDFQCPFCSRVEPQVAEIMKNYGDKVKFVWRHKPLPMHPDAPLASEAAEEALKQKGNDAFWKMHDKLFKNQGEKDGLKREALEKYAEELGLDMAKFKAALDNRTHKAKVDADDKAGTEAGINGTPAFVINGYFVSGAQPYPKFKKLIDRALAEAK
ncbi:MAG: thioredoxin domain-containing protein [Myxococcales bacterium]|nr:thioredoxin domain-containing protein [Myxococcales bacterium]